MFSVGFFSLLLAAKSSIAFVNSGSLTVILPGQRRRGGPARRRRPGRDRGLRGRRPQRRGARDPRRPARRQAQTPGTCLTRPFAPLQSALACPVLRPGSTRPRRLRISCCCPPGELVRCSQLSLYQNPANLRFRSPSPATRNPTSARRRLPARPRIGPGTAPEWACCCTPS